MTKRLSDADFENAAAEVERVQAARAVREERDRVDARRVCLCNHPRYIHVYPSFQSWPAECNVDGCWCRDFIEGAS